MSPKISKTQIFPVRRFSAICVLMQSSEFFAEFPPFNSVQKNESVQQRTNALSSELFEGQFQFHVRKKLQNDPQNSKKPNFGV